MYRKSIQSSRLEAPSLPVQFYVSALIQIHTAWELTPPPVCFLCVCVEVQPTTCLLALQARLPSTPEGALWCFAVFMCKCSACKYVPVACDLSCFPHEAVPHLSIYGGTAMRAKARFHSLKIKPGHIRSYTVTRKPQWGSLTWVKHMQWLSTFFIWTPVGLYNVYTFMVLFLLKY